MEYEGGCPAVVRPLPDLESVILSIIRSIYYVCYTWKRVEVGTGGSSKFAQSSSRWKVCELIRIWSCFDGQKAFPVLPVLCTSFRSVGCVHQRCFLLDGTLGVLGCTASVVFQFCHLKSATPDPTSSK